MLKGSGLIFYRFPADPESRAKWVGAGRREDWQPSEYSWICLVHFINGKSDDPLLPDYVPSIFEYIRSPLTRKRVSSLEDYTVYVSICSNSMR